jgi:hypothetical protein
MFNIVTELILFPYRPIINRIFVAPYYNQIVNCIPCYYLVNNKI